LLNAECNGFGASLTCRQTPPRPRSIKGTLWASSRCGKGDSMKDSSATTQTSEDPVKKTIIVVLTLVFVALYVIAIVGKTKWNSDKDAIQLLQPIVYVIIGYFFGRLPSEATEKSLRKEAQEKAQQANQADAKLKGVRAVLTGAIVPPTRSTPGVLMGGTPPGPPPPQDDARVAAALRILNE
jgi:hypothetical protein